MSDIGSRQFGQLWDRFLKEAVPPDCTEEQRERVKKIFYSGAYSMLQLITELDQKYSDNEAVQTAAMQEICAEFFLFFTQRNTEF